MKTSRSRVYSWFDKIDFFNKFFTLVYKLSEQRSQVTEVPVYLIDYSQKHWDFSPAL